MAIPPSDQTFLFADLAGYTALTEAHGDSQAADLAEGFCIAVKEMLPDDGAEAVKMIGDAVMVRMANAGQAVELAVRLISEIGAKHGFPSVRVGMHTGPAVERAGDWFGAAVNTAARVSGLARGGEILVTEATRRAVDNLDGLKLSAQGRHELKNVAQPVAIYRVEAEGSGRAGEMPITATPHLHVSGGAEFPTLTPPLRAARARRSTATRRVLAVTQGASYLYFGLWSLLRRDHYRSTHELECDDWVVNAHGGWLSIVGATLMVGGVRGRQDSSELTTLAVGSALALAANDALLSRRIAAIYRLDLAYEATLAALWGLTARTTRRRCS